MKWFKTQLSTASHLFHNGNKTTESTSLQRCKTNIQSAKSLDVGRINSFLKVAVPSPATRSAGSSHCSSIDCTCGQPHVQQPPGTGARLSRVFMQRKAKEGRMSITRPCCRSLRSVRTPRRRGRSLGEHSPKAPHRHTRNTHKGSKGNTRGLHHPQHTHDPKGIAQR